MVVLRLSSGLGNQLFQYALGRNLAIKNKTDLKFDVSPFQKDIRVYTLDAFNVAGIPIARGDWRVAGLPDMDKQDIISKIRRKLFRFRENHQPIYKRKIIIEPQFEFCPDILKTGNNCYLSGNWQSEKYFLNIKDVIKKDITLKNETTPATKEWLKKIDSCNSVSLHIRRGDYVSDQKVNWFHGTCDSEYYQRAIKLITEKIDNPEFFVFSDDIEWAKNNFKTGYPLFFVSDKIIPDYEELILMSKCRHNIIANSSFSWWGAWLNDNQNKIVIVPLKWFNVPEKDEDLIPNDWIKL